MAILLQRELKRKRTAVGFLFYLCWQILPAWDPHFIPIQGVPNSNLKLKLAYNTFEFNYYALSV
jgi:hypothetical protein